MRQVLAALCVVVPSVVCAQARDPNAPPPPFLKGVRDHAEASGALERVQGERFFQFRTSGDEALLRVDVQLHPETGDLALDVRYLGFTHDLTVHTQSLWSAEGAIQVVRCAMRQGELSREVEVWAGEGRLEGRVHETNRPVRPIAFPWAPDGVPSLLMTFVLPCFYDQGWPLERAFRQLDETTFALVPRVARIVQPGDEAPEETFRVFTIVDPEARDDADPQTAVFIDEAGEILSVVRGDGTLTPLSPAEARRLIERHGLEVEPPAPAVPGAEEED